MNSRNLASPATAPSDWDEYQQSLARLLRATYRGKTLVPIRRSLTALLIIVSAPAIVLSCLDSAAMSRSLPGFLMLWLPLLLATIKLLHMESRNEMLVAVLRVQVYVDRELR